MTMAGWCFPSRLRDLRKKNQNVLEAEAWAFGAQQAAPLQNLAHLESLPKQKT
jgi:hypothetical protein